MTLGELDVEVGHQGVDVVVALDLQAEGRGEGQVLRLHRVDVHFLGKGERAATARPYLSVLEDYSPRCVHEGACVKAHRLNHCSLITGHMLRGCPHKSR